MSDITNQIRGSRSNAEGSLFEGMLNASCRYYREKGMAVIEKTPEPMRPLKPYGYGQFIACFTKQAQPDYKGVLCDGRAIIFEAKHTSKDTIQSSSITETQRQNLNDFQKMGAQCYVMVSMGFEKFYRVPWSVFGDMDSRYGRKYMKKEDLEPYEIKQHKGTLLILEGVELHEDK